MLVGHNEIEARASENELSRVRSADARRENASRYSLFDPSHLIACQEREGAILAALFRRDYQSLEGISLLEIGCGTGSWLREFVRWGARPENITGIDVLPGRLAEAKVLCPAGITLLCRNAAELEFSCGAFDLVFQSTVFTSILDDHMRRQIAREMLRVVRPGGLIVWYDFMVNNPWNQDVRGVPRREVMALFPGCEFEFRKLTLAPPIARAVAPHSRPLCRFLQSLRIFDTHCLAIIQKQC